MSVKGKHKVKTIKSKSVARSIKRKTIKALELEYRDLTIKRHRVGELLRKTRNRQG